MKPPDVRCAQTGPFNGPTGKTWCGRVIGPSTEWLFSDASQAALNGLRGGKTMLCSSCGVAIRDAIKASMYHQRAKQGRADRGNAA